MEEIKIGEYVRSLVNGRISKVLEISDLLEESNIKYYKTGKFTGFCSTELYNVKHSKNIIDLIEVGDYVNGEIVRATYLEGTTHYIKIGEIITGKRTYNDDIKSIVTKEQFNSIAYRLED